MTLSLLRCAILGLLSRQAPVQMRMQMQVGCGRRRGGPRALFRAYYGGSYNKRSKAAPKRKGINIRVCRRRLASAQSRPDSGSQTSGTAG